MKLRAATPADVATILDFIRQLAAYEKEPEAVKMTQDELHDALFGDHPRAEALLVEIAGVPQGFAIWHENFNTWTGRPGLYLEDVYVVPDARKRGIGGAIFEHLAQLALARGYARFEWTVLNWNEPAVRFYKRLGAEPLSDWTKYRLSGEALGAVASGVRHG